jgi:hypothetical protein
MYRTITLTLTLAAAVLVAGCGDSRNHVKGVVTLDGSPVEGASVSLVSSDGNTAYTGVSNASGQFEPMSSDGKGVPSGTYKVIVFKTAVAQGTEGVEVGGGDYMKMMAKEAKAAQSRKAATPMNTPMPGRKMGKASGESEGGVKSELPGVYANFGSTPISVTVPPETITVELKSK